MPIDFPTGPTTGQVYTYSNKSWIYNGTAWDIAALPLRSTLEYLVIAGGGSGACLDGGEGGGGGGAGGYRTNVVGQLSGGSSTAEPAFTFSLNTNYPIAVGAGGVATPFFFGYQAGVIGNRSFFSVITSQGGGGGRTRFTSDNATGGSGGGGCQHGPSRGIGIIGQGTNGGLGPNANNINAAGGGGGAGVEGPIGPTGANGTAGGAGLSSNITGSAVTRAGGGGGGGNNSGGAGGAGGGGAGSAANVNGNSATVNTGSGGGGATNRIAGNGGSGIVILRYPSQYTITIGAGLTGSTATVEANKVTTITAGTGNVSWE
jgi:hypothetical protein